MKTRAIVLSLALLGGCDKKKDDGPAASPATTGAKATEAAAAKPADKAAEPPAASKVTKDQADAFGKKMAEAMAKCDGKGIDALIDTRTFSDRAIAAAGKSAASALRNTTVGPSLCAGLGDDFTVTYKGVYDKDGSFRPRIRTIVRGGVNFLEPVLDVGRDGTVKAVDIFSLRNGENMSDLLALVGKFLGHASGPQAAKDYVEATKKHGEGNYVAARAAFQRIPTELRAKIKAVALQGLTIDVQHPPDVYLASIDEFRKNFPDDASVDMVEIDAHSLRKEHEKLIASLTRLMNKVDEDAYVQVLRALAHKDARDLAAAKTDAEAAFKKEPTLVPAMDLVLDVAIAQKRFADGIPALDAMVASGIDKQTLVKTLAADAHYAPLAKSAEYKAWVKAAAPAPAAGSAN